MTAQYDGKTFGHACVIFHIVTWHCFVDFGTFALSLTTKVYIQICLHFGNSRISRISKKIDAITAVTEFVVIPASNHSNSKQKGQQWATFLALIHVIQNNYGNDFVSDTFSFMWFVESRLNCKTVQCHNGFTIPTERITVLYKYSTFFLFLVLNFLFLSLRFCSYYHCFSLFLFFRSVSLSFGNLHWFRFSAIPLLGHVKCVQNTFLLFWLPKTGWF